MLSGLPSTASSAKQPDTSADASALRRLAIKAAAFRLTCAHQLGAEYSLEGSAAELEALLSHLPRATADDIRALGHCAHECFLATHKIAQQLVASSRLPEAMSALISAFSLVRGRAHELAHCTFYLLAAAKAAEQLSSATGIVDWLRRMHPIVCDIATKTMAIGTAIAARGMIDWLDFLTFIFTKVRAPTSTACG